MNILMENPLYIWLIIGLLLMIFEITAPGVFLLWFGLAALTTGIVQIFLPLSLPLQLLVFALSSAIWVFIGRKVYKRLGDVTSDTNTSLNERTKRYIGQIATVEAPIEDGQGRIHVGDNSWICYCDEDIPIGGKVKIIDAKGAAFIVEKLRKA